MTRAVDRDGAIRLARELISTAHTDMHMPDSDHLLAAILLELRTLNDTLGPLASQAKLRMPMLGLRR